MVVVTGEGLAWPWNKVNMVGGRLVVAADESPVALHWNVAAVRDYIQRKLPLEVANIVEVGWSSAAEVVVVAAVGE